MTISYQADLRYHGQGLRLTVAVDLKELQKSGLKAISAQFDEEHKRLFTFALPLEHELVTLRAAVQGQGIKITRQVLGTGGPDPKAAAVGKQKSYMQGKDVTAIVYDRSRLKADNKVRGPAIVMEMDSTTVVLPKHTGTVDRYGNILIYPDGYTVKGARRAPAQAAKAKSKASAKGAPRKSSRK